MLPKKIAKTKRAQNEILDNQSEKIIEEDTKKDPNAVSSSLTTNSILTIQSSICDKIYKEYLTLFNAMNIKRMEKTSVLNLLKVHNIENFVADKSDKGK